MQPNGLPGASGCIESYKNATTTPFEQVCDYTETFLQAVARESPAEESATPRIVDFERNSSGPQFVAIYPDQTRIFVGRDETSTDSGLFAVILEDRDVWTVTGALDVLKPPLITQAERSTGTRVQRQGEWWFVEAEREPAFVVSGDLGAKPYGPSPMANHVAREYGFGLPETELLSALSLAVSDGRCSRVFEAVPACFDAI